MSTQTGPGWLNAFVDGEMDLASQLEIEQRLRGDAALRAQVEALRGLRGAMRSQADYHGAPTALRARFQAVSAASASRPSGARTVVQQWFAWRPLLASLGVIGVLVVATNLELLRSGRDEQLRQDVIASHVRATLSQRLVDVASSDRHTVKPWLSSRLDYSPPVSAPTLPGLEFLGGRVDYVAGRPVSVLVYRQRQHVIDHLVWPTAEPDQHVTFATRNGFHLVHWSSSSMEHWMVSDLNQQELAALWREVSESSRE